MALQGPILTVPDVLFWYRQYTTRTDEERVKRQGHIPDEAAVLSAKHTYLQESLTDAVHASALPRRTKAIITADVWRAAYFEDSHPAATPGARSGPDCDLRPRTGTWAGSSSSRR